MKYLTTLEAVLLIGFRPAQTGVRDQIEQDVQNCMLNPSEMNYEKAEVEKE